MSFEEDLRHIRVSFPYNESFIYSSAFMSIQDKAWLPYFREWQVGASHYEEILDLLWQYFSPECKELKELDLLPERPEWLEAMLGTKGEA